MSTRPLITRRILCPNTFAQAQAAGLDPLTCRIIAARVQNVNGNFTPFLQPSLAYLDAPSGLPDIAVATNRLADAIERGEKIGVITDYDVDGITSHTLIRESLVEDFGVPENLVCGFIGHRLTEGYGLSEPVCERILAAHPAVVITADCGSSDEPRIKRLKAAGIDVVVTDHHGIPEAGVPESALATVSPARADAIYPDKAIAGCTVAWLLMSSLRRELINRQRLAATCPKLTRHLDLVSLGTVADAVSLFSANNRAIVTAGLMVLNQQQRPCWQALAELLGTAQRAFTVDDLGFQIGPRINARGRMEDPFAAWHFLAATDLAQARKWLALLDENNEQRKATEAKMVRKARHLAADNLKEEQQVIVVYDDDFHAGVQGIVASRLLDSFGRVSCVMSPGNEAQFVSGSLRSVAQVDVNAALKRVQQQHPQLLTRFGGHKAAAGVTIEAQSVQQFADALADAVREQLGNTQLAPQLFTDGALESAQINWHTWHQLQGLAPFGRGFEKPQFDGSFEVASIRAVGADPVHLSLSFKAGGQVIRGIWFKALNKAGDDWPLQVGDQAFCVFELEPDSYRGGEAMQLIVRYAQAGNAELLQD